MLSIGHDIKWKGYTYTHCKNADLIQQQTQYVHSEAINQQGEQRLLDAEYKTTNLFNG